MKKITMASLWVLAACILAYWLTEPDGGIFPLAELDTPVFAATDAAGSSPGFEIGEFPRNLRTDLAGASIKVSLPENAPDRPWDDALMAKFHELTGIEVQTIRPGNDTSVVLSSYLKEFENDSPQADVYAIDIVWPGILSAYAEDLRPEFGDLRDMAPGLAENNTVNGKLVAIPYFVEISLLYYRRDLLEKYGFGHPPRTWSELEHESRVIENGERADGRGKFWGYLWQGAPSEALTCNALEWQISQGGGPLLKPDGTLSMQSIHVAKAWERAQRWIGTISPPDVTGQLEDDSLRDWKNGDAAFMRNWPYAYLESMKPDSSVRDRIGVTLLPMGNGPNGRHADTLGGFQLMVSKTSKNKAAAIELIKFLTSPEIQRVNAATRGYAPTRPIIYSDPDVLKTNPFFGTLRDVLLEGAVIRPSTAAGSRYEAVSTAYFMAVRQTLTGRERASAAVAKLDKDLQRILSK